jgi:hypothetical protein
LRNLLAEFDAREIYVLGRVVQVEGHHGTPEAVNTLKATISMNKGQAAVPDCLLMERAGIGGKYEI